MAFERMEFPKGKIGSYHYMPDFYLHEFWRFVFLQQKVGEYAQTFIDCGDGASAKNLATGAPS